MPLSPEQLWIAKFTGGVTLSEDEAGELSLDDQLELRQQVERREEQILRETYIRRAHEEAATLSEELKVFRQARLSTTSGKMDMIGKGGDQTQAFGYEEDISRLKASPKELSAMTNAKGKVLSIQKGLQAVIVKRSAVDLKQGRLVTFDAPLFEDRDIENELFTPLVRSLLYPEDQVASEFSATQRMIDGSNQYYIDDLVARSEESSSSAESWGQVLKAVTTAVKDVASATTSLVTQVNLSGASPDKALELLKTRDLINLGLMVGEAVVNTSIDVGVQISKGDAASGVSVVLSGLSGAVGGLVKQFTGNAELAKYISIGMKGGSRLPRLIQAFTMDGTPEQKAGAFLEQLGGLWGDAFDITSVATNDTSDPNNTDNQKQIALVKLGITTAYSGVSSAMKAGVISKIEKRDWNGLAQIVVSTSATVVKGGLAGVAIEQAAEKKALITTDSVTASLLLKNPSQDPTDESFLALVDKTRKDQIAAVDTGFAKSTGSIDTSTSALVKNANGLIAKGKNDEEDPIAKKIKEREAAVREEQEKANRSSVEEATKRLQDDEAEFGETLRLMGKDEFTETDLKSIGKLIAKMQQDRMIMQTASAIGGAGFAVASQFFAPMAIAGTIIKFLEALTAAVNRAIELRNWVDASGNAMNAVSPYLTAIQNFVRNQAEQFSHYTIKCALIAVQVAAQIVQVAGAGTYAQAVGLVVEKGAKLAETLEDLSFKFYKEATLRAAWKATKPALQNPSNRKANLIARKLNPTLAKYTLAFGAVIDKDPVALQAFQIIGLDAETLSARDAKVSTVKAYLEARYDDDVQVYKSFSVPSEDSWLNKAPAPALTVDCFVTLHILAVEKGGVTDTRPNAITAAFRTAEQKRAAQLEATQRITALDPITEQDLLPHEPIYLACEEAFRQLAMLLRGFAPPRKDGKGTDDDLQGALADLAELAEAEAESLRLDGANLFGRAAPEPPIGPPPDPEELRQQLAEVEDALRPPD